MRYFSMFSGVEGFGQGIEQAYEKRTMDNRGATSPPELDQHGNMSGPDTSNGDGRRSNTLCVGFSEVNKYASQVLKYKYPNVKNYGDCTKINWSEVPDFDLLTGGSPCQDFSIAGKRAGIVGERSGLVWEYIRCLEEKKPKYFIWENVKGVMSSRGGWDFANILTAFSEAGYSLGWQVLNAKDFGVPQNRERIFVVGFREGSPPEVFFERGGDSRNMETLRNEQGKKERIRSDTASVDTRTGSTARGQHLIMNMHTSARNPNRKSASKGGSGPLLSQDKSFAIETGQPHYVIETDKTK